MIINYDPGKGDLIPALTFDSLRVFNIDGLTVDEGTERWGGSLIFPVSQCSSRVSGVAKSVIVERIGYGRS